MKQIQGKYLVMAILGLGMAMAGFNLVYQTAGASRTLKFLGSSAARLIAAAPRVQALLLRPASEPDAEDATVRLHGQVYEIVRSEEIGQARGLLHVRRALLRDDTWLWESPPEQTTWRYVLRFIEGDKSTEILFDAEGFTAGLPQREKLLSIRPNPDGESPLKAFLEEQFP